MSAVNQLVIAEEGQRFKTARSRGVVVKGGPLYIANVIRSRDNDAPAFAEIPGIWTGHILSADLLL